MYDIVLYLIMYVCMYLGIEKVNLRWDVTESIVQVKYHSSRFLHLESKQINKPSPFLVPPPIITDLCVCNIKISK